MVRLENALEDRDEEIAEMKEELNQYADLRNENDHLRKEVSRLEGQSTDARKENDRLGKEHADVKKENRELREELERIEFVIDAAKKRRRLD